MKRRAGKRLEASAATALLLAMAYAFAFAGISAAKQPASIPVAPGWPARNASDFAGKIDNPWFPLITGSSWVSIGIKDGKPTVDTFTVTGRTKVIEGVTTHVVRDVLTVNGKPIEVTSDWYAQDKQGNVWYFGENTKEFNAAGKVTSTSGTWRAGVKGARPGIYMPAHPMVGMGGYQEYWKGQALDHYRILSLSASVKVPYGSFTKAMKTRETTVLEPGVVDRKFYVRGIGQVSETTAKGPTETSFLQSFTK
jgi:hypothetical protein